MPKYDDDTMVGFATDLQTCVYELRADALTLQFWKNRHWSKTYAVNCRHLGDNRHWTKRYVTDKLSVFAGDKRDGQRASTP